MGKAQAAARKKAKAKAEKRKAKAKNLQAQAGVQGVVNAQDFDRATKAAHKLVPYAGAQERLAPLDRLSSHPLAQQHHKRAAKKLMLVDGYNVIRFSPRYASMIHKDPQITDVYALARDALISDVVSAAGSEFEVIVIFDGAKNPCSEGKRYKQAGLTVLFSPYKREADSLIEEYATQARLQGREVVVVSSDAAIQFTVTGDGVSRLSSRMFLDELADAQYEFEQQSGFKPKAPIESRIDPAVREKLARLARGESLD